MTHDERLEIYKSAFTVLNAVNTYSFIERTFKQAILKALKRLIDFMENNTFEIRD